MTPETATIMQAWASIGAVAIGLAQCGLIWAGLRQMRKSSDERSRQLDIQEQAAADRHRESMRALEVLIERTAS